jgi:fatty-acyl-CoA synthase
MATKLERSYIHRGGERPLIGETVDRFLAGIVRRHPEQEAVVSVATDNVEWVLLQLATARVGAILVNINPAYRIQELEHALRLARVQGLFLIPSFRSSDYIGMVSELVPELESQQPDELRPSRLPDLRRVVVYDPRGRGDESAPGVLRWDDVIERGTALPDEATRVQSGRLDPDDPINIQFTSGTTGFPKAVVLTHHNIVNNGFSVSEQMDFTPADRLCVPVPFYHCFGMVISNLGCLTHGSTIVIPTEHFDAGAILRAIAEERCTAVHGVPAMFVAELEHPEFESFDLASLRTGIMAGAPCPPELMRRVIRDMGIEELRIAYGQTEASPVTHMTRRIDSFERRVETVGTNLPHQEVKVVDVDSGAVVPVGKQGEICFRGYHVMRGYYDQPEATAQAIEPGGWLHSGDLGVMDEDGYVRITGRIKEMIIRGGENIYPAEIEAFYYTHQDVAEVAVFGVPDERLGEEVGAWVKLKEGASAGVEELRDFACERIAHFKVPRYLWIVGEFPTTVTGKVQKFRIVEIVEDWLQEDARSA